MGARRRYLLRMLSIEYSALAQADPSGGDR
jgi:hypothetical protein